MINEKKFASAYSSFWRVTLPLSNSYVRHVNSNLASFLTGHQIAVSTERVALLSELGFRCYARWYTKLRLEGQSIDRVELEELALQTWNYIRALEGAESNLSPPNFQDYQEALIIADRIRTFF